MPRPRPIFGLIVAIVLFTAVAYPLYLIYSTRGVVSLEELREKQSSWTRLQFAKTKQGLLLFFTGESRLRLAELVRGGVKTLDLKVVEFDPNTRKKQTAILPVTMAGQEIKFGPHLVSTNEVQRLRLTPDWDKALKWLDSSLYTKKEIKSGYISPATHQFALERVKDNLFLISGCDWPSNAKSFYGDSEWKKFYEICGSVNLLDTTQGKIVKTIPLKLLRYGHTSVLFPDGKVILVGGSSYKTEKTITENSQSIRSYTVDLDNAELIDLKAGTTKLISIDLPDLNCYCFDDSGACIWVESSKNGNIYKFNPENSTIKLVGSLKQFNFPSTSEEVPENAIQISANKILVCGGDFMSIMGYPGRGFIAEIAEISSTPQTDGAR